MNLSHIHAAAAVRAACSEQALKGETTVTLSRATLEQFLEMHDAYEAFGEKLKRFRNRATIAFADAIAAFEKIADGDSRMLARRLRVLMQEQI